MLFNSHTSQNVKPQPCKVLWIHDFYPILGKQGCLEISALQKLSPYYVLYDFMKSQNLVEKIWRKEKLKDESIN